MDIFVAVVYYPGRLYSTTKSLPILGAWIEIARVLGSLSFSDKAGAIGNGSQFEFIVKPILQLSPGVTCWFGHTADRDTWN